MKFVPPSSGLWRCVAGSASRSYEIEQVDRQAQQLLLTIYNAPQIDPQQRREVVPMQVTESGEQGMVASGVTRQGETVQVHIFQQKSVGFTVQDSAAGVATGSCSYLDPWE